MAYKTRTYKHTCVCTYTPHTYTHFFVWWVQFAHSLSSTHTLSSSGLPGVGMIGDVFQLVCGLVVRYFRACAMIVCVCACVHVCCVRCVCVCVCVRVCVLCACVCVCVLCVRARACVCVCCVCVCVCVCVHAYIRMHIVKGVCLYPCTVLRMSVCVWMCVLHFVCVYVRTYVCTYVCLYVWCVCISVCMCVLL